MLSITRSAAVALALMLAAGCTSKPVTPSSVPNLAQDGLRFQSKPLVADAAHAKVTLASVGNPMPVTFTKMSNGASENLGTVSYINRKQVFGWIAKMVETTNSVTLRRQPRIDILARVGEPISLRGWAGGLGTNFTCGPLRSTFSPEAGKAYLVEFRFEQGGCLQAVYEVTPAGARVPVGGNEGPVPLGNQY